MSQESARRRVVVERVSPQRFAIVNDRGRRVTTGMADGDDLSPIELLLGAIGACTAIDVDILTSRRAEPSAFSVEVTAQKMRNEGGNQLDDIQLTFRVRFPDGADGDAAREVLPKAVQRSHDQLCTVSRTVELGAEVTVHLADDEDLDEPARRV